MADEFLTFGPADADIAGGMHRQPALDPAVSLADYAARTTEAPEPVGRTLRAASERGFTGELILSLGTGVRVFLDDGRPYYAERVGDAPLCQRLVSLGVLTDGQRARGRVLVGDVEHVGRLFDRDPSIDRDAVIAAVEVLTDELITDIGGGTASVEVTPYRHHASGVHRWFVGPSGASTNRPGDIVTSFDRGVFERMPDLDRGAAAPLPPPAPELSLEIEWHDDIGENPGDEASGREVAVDAATAEFEVEYDLDAEWERFDAARHDAVHGSVPDASHPSPDQAGSTSTPGLPAPSPRPLTSPPVAAPATPAESLAPPGAVAMPPPTSATPPPRPGAASSDAPLSEPPKTTVTSATALTPPVTEPLGAPAPVKSVVSDDDRPAEPMLPDGVDASALPFDEPFTIVWPDGSIEPTAAIERASTPRNEPAAAFAQAELEEPTSARPSIVDEQPAPPGAPEVASSAALVDAGPDQAGEGGDRTPPNRPASGTLEPATTQTDHTTAPPPPSSASAVLRIPALELDRLPEPDAEVPDDVADAVRRALAAIERAAAEPEAPARLRVGTVDLPDFSVPRLLAHDESSPASALTGPVDGPSSDQLPAQSSASIAPSPVVEAEPVGGDRSLDDEPDAQRSRLDAAPVVEAEHPGGGGRHLDAPAPCDADADTVDALSDPEVDSKPTLEPADDHQQDVATPASAAIAFAPPTADSRAEAIYARAATPAVTNDAEDRPAPGQTSVVFVDEESEGDERTGALRRLIGSLRRSK